MHPVLQIAVSSVIAVGSYNVTNWALNAARSPSKRFYNGKDKEVLIDLAKDNGVLMFSQIRKALRSRPSHLTIEMIGIGNPSIDGCLACYEYLQDEKKQGLKVTTIARSSLMSGSLLLWLSGDERKIRDSAFMYLDEMEEKSPWEECNWQANYRVAFGVMNQFFPVKEFLGRRHPMKRLYDYGLLNTRDEEKALAALFG